MNLQVFGNNAVESWSAVYFVCSPRLMFMGVWSWFAHLENFSLISSRSASFVIRVNLLHP